MGTGPVSFISEKKKKIVGQEKCLSLSSYKILQSPFCLIFSSKRKRLTKIKKNSAGEVAFSLNWNIFLKSDRPGRCSTNRKWSLQSLKPRQPAIRFTLKAPAADRIASQENVRVLAERNLQGHSDNSSSCKRQLHHRFCLANLAARCEGFASVVRSREVGT